MALTASVALMAIPTFLIGTLPTYQQIGVTASVLLVLMRLLQGLSVGGEYTISSIFLVEHSATGRRGFFGSFAEVGACSGVLLGSALSGLVTTVLDRAVVDSGAGVSRFSSGSRSALSAFTSADMCSRRVRRKVGSAKLRLRDARPSPNGAQFSASLD